MLTKRRIGVAAPGDHTGVLRGTLFEELLAASLTQLFQAGNTDEETLLRLSRLRIASFASQPGPADTR